MFSKNDTNADFKFVSAQVLWGLVFLTTWTLGTHLITLTALPFNALYGVVAIGVVLATVATIAFSIDEVFRPTTLALPTLTFSRKALRQQRWRLLTYATIFGLIFISVAGVLYKFTFFLPFWFVLIAIAAISIFSNPLTGNKTLLIFHTHQVMKPSLISSNQLTFLVAVVLCLIYFFTSIPDEDDSLFLNLALGAIQSPKAVFAFDNMLGLDGLSMIKSTYRLESYQLLSALIADITGLPVIYAAHTVLPFIMCLWTAAILTLIHNALFPNHKIITLAAHLVILFSLAGALQSYGYHGIPRYFQGKGVFVTAIVPLLTVLAVSTILESRIKSLLLLSASLVVAIGFTANAIYAAPLVVALIAFPAFCHFKKMRLHLIRLTLILIYPVFIVVILLLTDPPGPSEILSAGTAGEMLWSLTGTHFALFLFLLLMFSAAIVGGFDKRLRLISLYTLGLLIFVLNPFMWEIYGSYVTGNVNYRLLWSLPYPLILAILFGLLWSSGEIFLRAGLVLLAVFSITGAGSIFQKAELGFSPVKVRQPYFDLAATTTEMAAPSGLILAPELISAWIPTLDNKVPVVEARGLYIPQREAPAFRDILDSRARLFLSWNEPQENSLTAGMIASLISESGVTFVVADTRLIHHIDTLPKLELLGFRTVRETPPYQFLQLHRLSNEKTFE